MQAAHKIVYRRATVIELHLQGYIAYETLMREQRTAKVNTLARRVLEGVPMDARKRPEVVEYRALISAPASPEKMVES